LSPEIDAAKLYVVVLSRRRKSAHATPTGGRQPAMPADTNIDGAPLRENRLDA